jgi:hypothetical protein
MEADEERPRDATHPARPEPRTDVSPAESTTTPPNYLDYEEIEEDTEDSDVSLAEVGKTLFILLFSLVTLVILILVGYAALSMTSSDKVIGTSGLQGADLLRAYAEERSRSTADLKDIGGWLLTPLLTLLGTVAGYIFARRNG